MRKSTILNAMPTVHWLLSGVLAGAPAAPAQVASARQAAAAHEPTNGELARLYIEVGRELQALESKKGSLATVDLWPRYRWIRIDDAFMSADKRRTAWQVLEKIRTDSR